jgi:N-acetylglucosamine-6-phosphate deacetylase
VNAGSVTARFLRTGMPVKVSWENGLITRVQPAEESGEVHNLWLAPPLVDLQVNGYAGVDFQQDDLAAEQLLTAVRALRRDDCTHILFTLITDDWPVMLARVRRARALAEGDSELRAAIAGWHLEGPFLSPEPGYCGAHDPGKMCDPTSAHMDELRAEAGNDPVLLTLAPERPGALDAIKRAVELGFKVCLGHTNASAAQLREAVDAGATGFTHLGNACPQLLDRHDNILWRVLDTPGLAVSLIPDMHHVSPALFRLIHRLLKPFQIMHTTDAMSAAGASWKGDIPVAQTFTLGTMRLEVGADGIVRQPGRTNFAGSALRPFDGVLRATQMTGQPWQEMWLASSLRPAEFMGWTNELKAGQPADFCVVETEGDGDPIRIAAHHSSHPCYLETVEPRGRLAGA